MKFRDYLDVQARDIWRSQYIKYTELKRLLHEVLETDAPVVVPQVLSLSGHGAEEARRLAATPQERFFVELEAQVAMVNSFTQAQAQLLRTQLCELEVRLRKLQGRAPLVLDQLSVRTASLITIGGDQPAPSGPPGKQQPAAMRAFGRRSVGATSLSRRGSVSSPGILRTASGGLQGGEEPLKPPPEAANPATWARLQGDTQAVALEYLALEKYVNVNFAALQKVLKEHDHLVPSAPCWPFYRMHIANQPWVKGDHHDIQVTLRRLFTQLHAGLAAVARKAAGSPAGTASPPVLMSPPPLRLPSQHHAQTTRTFWVRMEDLAEVEFRILLHLPAARLARLSPSPSLRYPLSPGHHDDDSHTKRINALYLDNRSLELYHSLLYGRPYATLVNLQWEGRALRPNSPVLLRRTVFPEGWRPDTLVQDTFELEEMRVSEFLSGRWTFADARKFMQRKSSGSDAGSASRTQGTAQRTPSVVTADAAALSSLAAEMEAMQKEYALFKTYTEVQRLIESKALQPMVRISMNQTVFAEPSEGASAGLLSPPGSTPPFLPPQALPLAPSLSQPTPSAGVHAEWAAAAAAELQEPSSGTQEAGPSGSGSRAGPSNAPPAAATLPRESRVVRVQMDTNIQALLEYSTDGQVRIANGLWRQARHTDCVDFPYGVITVEVSSDAALGAGDPFTPPPLPDWLQHLVTDGKMLEVHDFSKFLFGCAGVLPDMVRAVPWWIDDPLLAACLAAQALGQSIHLHKHISVGDSGRPSGSSMLQHGSLKGRRDAAAAAVAAAALALDGPGSGDLSADASRSGPDGVAAAQLGLGGTKGHAHQEQAPAADGLPAMLKDAAGRVGGAAPGWQLKLLARQSTARAVYAPQALFIETSQFLHNERSFLMWLMMCVNLSAIALAMLGFAASAKPHPLQVSGAYVSEWTAIVQLAMSIVTCGYALWAFVWRSFTLYELSGRRYGDTNSSTYMALLLLAALTALLLLNVFDMIEFSTRDKTPDDPDPAGGGTDPGQGMASLLARCSHAVAAPGPVSAAVRDAGCRLLRAVRAMRGG